jgi:hypothetical protein
MNALPASMTASVINDWNPDLVASEAKPPLNPWYGGGPTRNVGSDNEVQTIRDYAHFRDFENWLKSINVKMVPPTRRATRRPTLRSRFHAAHVLIKRITSNGIKI